MANKISIPSDGQSDNNGQPPIKKKKHRCLTCCLVFLIVMLVIFGAAFGVGWYFGDKYTKEYFDMSLGDTLGVLSDLYWTDDEDVVKNPFGNGDIDGFYSEIKRNILLKDDAEVDFDGALTAALDKYINGSNDSDGAESARAVRKKAAGESTDGEQDGEENSIMNVLVDMIANVMTRDNIDLQRLNNYNDADPATDEYVFNLNDRQLAAFVDHMLKAVLKDATKIESLSGFADMVDMSKCVALKQIIFAAQTEKDADGVDVAATTTADITVWVGLQDAASRAIAYFLNDAGFGWASGFVGWLGDVFLPENVYLTVTMPLYGEAKPQITLNDMSAAERARSYKLINGILRTSGSDSAITDILDDFAEKVRPYLEKVSQKMPLDNVTHGTVTFDLLDALATAASEETEGEPLTKADFIYVLQSLLSDPSAQLKRIEPHRYRNRYTDASGNEVYIAEGGNTEGLTEINYEHEFIEAIEEKYALDFGDDPNTSLTDVLALLGVSADGSGEAANSKEIVKLINAERFNAAVEADIADCELIVTDRMLAAALSGQMDAMLTESGSGFEDLTITLDALTFVGDADRPGHMYALMYVEIDVAELLGTMEGDALITRLATGIMPEKILLSMKADITRSLEAGDAKDDVQFVINSCANTDRALAAIGKLVPSLDLGEMSEKLETMLHDMLDRMYEKLDVRLVATTMEYNEQTNGFDGELGELILPDIFTVITDTVLTDCDERLDAEMLKSVIRGLNDTDAFSDYEPFAPEENYSRFIADVVDKYYLAPDGELRDFDGLTAFMTDFDTHKFRVRGNDADTVYLAYDTRGINELAPIMTGRELGVLLKEKTANNTATADYEIVGVNTARDMLSIVLAISAEDMFEGEAEDVRALLTADSLYVTADVDVSARIGSGAVDDPYAYPVSLAVNGMRDSTDETEYTAYDAMFEIVRTFMPSFDIGAQVDEFGKTLYEQIQSLNNSIGGSDDGASYFRFDDDGLVMTDFYTFLSNKMGLESDAEPSTVKAALQGMYMRSEIAELYNDDNYVLSDIMLNSPPQGQAAWTNDEYAAFLASGGTYADTEFNAMLKHGVGLFANDEDASVVQTTVLARGETDVAALEVCDWANARLNADAERIAVDETNGVRAIGGDYVLITFRMATGKFMDSKDDAGGFLLDYVYATVVYKMTSGADSAVFEQINDVIFNDMTNGEYEVIKDVMGFHSDSADDSKVNIVTVAARSASVLNSLTEAGDIVFGGRVNDTGVGSITFTPENGAATPYGAC